MRCRKGERSPQLHHLHAPVCPAANESRCPQGRWFPCGMRKHNVIKLPKHYLSVAYMSSGVQTIGRRGQGLYIDTCESLGWKSKNEQLRFFQHSIISEARIKCILWIFTWMYKKTSLWPPPPAGQNRNFLRPWELLFWLNIWEISQKTITLNQYDIASANKILLTSNILWITD